MTANASAPAIALDGRPSYLRVVGWMRDLIGAVGSDQWDSSTPCGEWDVRTLVSHSVATIERLVVIGQGLPPFSRPSFIEDIPATASNAEWIARLDAALAEWHSVWDDDDVLERDVTMPWGEAVGRIALVGYVQEMLVHCWDLATALGEPSDRCDDLATELLPLSERMMPRDRRGDGIPFDAPVDPAPGASETEKLVNWLGRAA